MNFLSFRHIVHEDSELHIFVDTSSKTYGVAAYIVSSTNQCSNLLTSKVRGESPHDSQTALLVGVQLIPYLTNLFKFNNLYLWSDSKVAISWITSDTDVKDIYVANRVTEIKTLATNHNINVLYVPMKDNPADHLS